MNLQMGTREKIVGLVVLCLVTIIVVHYFLIMTKANQYRSAHEQYLNELSKRQGLFNPQSEKQITKFIEQTQNIEDFFKELASDLAINWDPIRDFDANTTGVVKKRQASLLKIIEQVCDLRSKYPKMRLTFLDYSEKLRLDGTLDIKGWDIPAQLPNIRPQDLWQRLSDLRVTLTMLDVIDPRTQPQQHALLQQRYDYNLQLIGIEPSHLLRITLQGEIVPTIKEIAHARLIWALMQKETDKAAIAKLQVDSIEKMYELLRVKLPKDDKILFHDIKQLEFLMRLIQLAQDQKVEEIYYVQLGLLRKIDVIPPPDKKSSPRLVPEKHFDMTAAMNVAGRFPGGTGWNPTGAYPGMPAGPPAYGQPGSRPAPAAAADTYEVNPYDEGGTPAGPQPGGPQGAAAPQGNPLEPTPTPDALPNEGGEWIGNVVPIKMGFISPWDIALNYLYVICHNRNPFEVDSLEMAGGLQSGKIQTEVTVVPMAVVKGIDAFYAPVTSGTTALASAPGGGAPPPPPGVAAPPASRPTPPGPPPKAGGAGNVFE